MHDKNGEVGSANTLKTSPNRRSKALETFGQEPKIFIPWISAARERLMNYPGIPWCAIDPI